MIITSCYIFCLFLFTLHHAILEAISCDVGEFHCLDKETCIPEAWVCDGEPDCPDDSDETDTICKFLIPSINTNVKLTCIILPLHLICQ